MAEGEDPCSWFQFMPQALITGCAPWCDWLLWSFHALHHPHNFCLPPISSSYMAVTPELGASTKVAPNAVSTLLLPVIFWWCGVSSLVAGWLKVWGYWDTLVGEGKVGGKVLMRITSSGLPPHWVISLVAASTTLLILGRAPLHFQLWRSSRNLALCTVSALSQAHIMLYDPVTGWPILIRKYQALVVWFVGKVDLRKRWLLHNFAKICSHRAILQISSRKKRPGNLSSAI